MILFPLSISNFIKNINGTERLYSGLALWLTEDNQTKEEYNVLPVWLKDQGYETVHIGKYLNGYGLDVPASYVPRFTHAPEIRRSPSFITVPVFNKLSGTVKIVFVDKLTIDPLL